MRGYSPGTLPSQPGVPLELLGPQSRSRRAVPEEEKTAAATANGEAVPFASWDFALAEIPASGDASAGRGACLYLQYAKQGDTPGSQNLSLKIT